jgi:Phosphate-induced protein 1 conserved region
MTYLTRTLTSILLTSACILACSSTPNNFFVPPPELDASTSPDANLNDASVPPPPSDASPPDASPPPCLPITCQQSNTQCGRMGDGCGNTLDCGSCTTGNSCTDGICGPTPCVPKTTCDTNQCGVVSDGCSGVLDCAACPNDGVCVANACCTPETDAVFCSLENKACGPVNGTDNCGTPRTVQNCGTCPNGGVCVSNSCCAPETDATFCALAGKVCGSFTGPDNCGTTRTVASCGTCSGTETCSPSGSICDHFVTDHGGPVMTTVHLYVLFWGSGFESTTQSLYQSFLTGFGSSPYAATNAQYLRGAADSITYKSSFVDTTNAIAANIMDSDLQGEITRVIIAGHLPYDVNGLYFVITPKTTTLCAGTECSCSFFCGYHSAYSDPSNRTVIYAALPSLAACPNGCGEFTTDASSPNKNLEADDGVNVMAHELMEAQSDPLGNAWYDTNGSGEVGDKCNFQYGATTPAADGAPVNQSWSGHYWLIQENWSNAADACVQQ